MALPLLANGAECGPSNALQNLTKTLDRDRGVQQDQFGARAGSSREVFRTQSVGTPTLDQDAARFFSGQRSSPQVPGVPAFDLSALQQSLPSSTPQLVKPGPAQPLIMPGTASWATDFLMQQPAMSPIAQSVIIPAKSAPMTQMNSPIGFENRDPMQTWSSPLAGPRLGMMPMFSPSLAQQHQQPQTNVHLDATSLDKEFQSFDNVPALSIQTSDPPATSEAKTRIANSELARTAASLIHAVRHEENPKFRESAFIELMRQLRDGEVVVEGNDFVPASSATTSETTDRKGKGRAIPQASDVIPPEEIAAVNAAFNPMGRFQSTSTLPQTAGPSFAAQASEALNATDQEQQPQAQREGEGDVDAYLRQHNDEYIDYWNSAGLSHDRAEATQPDAQQAEWGHLQRDWDNFEATASGIRAVPNYQFQPHNPYVLGSSSRTRNHMMHTHARQAINESVLELEAAVQRNPTDAQAWFELGVKQQENEREQKAIQALERALALDGKYLPAWLALAISYTNEGQRGAAHNAVSSWLSANEHYAAQYEAHRATHPPEDYIMLHEKVQSLIDCLINIARDQPEGGLDADVQIALAILLNINEDWEKSGDCFRAALSVRPEDWLLWNRVGATLANSGHADEALQFYNQAIQLNPLYIRARYNIGISLINTKRHWEAAEHLLDALVLQESDATPEPYGEPSQAVTSSSLWDSLRTACQQMQRLDLSAMCERRDLEGFRAAFEAQRVS